MPTLAMILDVIGCMNPDVESRRAHRLGHSHQSYKEHPCGRHNQMSHRASFFRPDLRLSLAGKHTSVFHSDAASPANAASEWPGINIVLLLAGVTGRDIAARDKPHRGRRAGRI